MKWNIESNNHKLYRKSQNIDEALKELSMIILSKESSDLLDERTKQLIKELFGENFGRIVENYEERIAKLSA